MRVVFTGRRTAVDEQLRDYLTDRLGRLDKLDPKVDRVDVEICEEHNPRQSHHKVRIELTWVSRGPVVRGEAAAADGHGAADLALGKLDRRLRRAADRRRIHHGCRTPVSVALATAEPSAEPLTVASLNAATSMNGVDHGGEADVAAGPMVVREKLHASGPMTLDQALFEMELVGHEFFLFLDADHGVPSVVYRRRGYDYGVLRLAPETGAEIATPDRGRHSAVAAAHA